MHSVHAAGGPRARRGDAVRLRWPSGYPDRPLRRPARACPWVVVRTDDRRGTL